MKRFQRKRTKFGLHVEDFPDVKVFKREWMRMQREDLKYRREEKRKQELYRKRRKLFKAQFA